MDPCSKMTSHTWLDARISQFWESLPPLHVFCDDTDPAAARALALTRALTAAAAITLHQRADAGAAAQRACVAAARAILACLWAADGVCVAPVVGALCALACGVLVEEVRTARAFRKAWAAGLGTPMSPPTSEEERLVVDVRDGLATMAVYATDSPLIGEMFPDLNGGRMLTAVVAHQFNILLRQCEVV